MSRINENFLVDLSFAGGDLDNAPNGDIQLIEGIKNLKQALFNRLITVEGSLVHRPNYGVGIKLYQNRVNNLSTQRDLALKIKRQFTQDPRVVSVDGVSFKSESNGKVIITYKITTVGYGQLSLTEEIE